MHTEIILQHGWAFDASCWNQWVEALEETGQVIVGERGYFGARKLSASFSSEADNKVVIAHSFGVHMLPEAVLAQCDLLILINSFINLKRNARAIKAMLKKFPSAPDTVIMDFWRNCYHPEFPGCSILPPPGMNETMLEDDLAAMLNNSLDVGTISRLPEVVLIHSSNDRIVAAETRKELTEALPNANVIDIVGGCHASNLTQAGTCLQLLARWISGNRSLTCLTQK